MEVNITPITDNKPRKRKRKTEEWKRSKQKKLREARILLKIENYNERIKTLEFENIGLKRNIEKLESNSKNNNLVIFGLNLTPEEVSVQNICNKLNTILEINLNRSVISDIYLLGGNTRKELINLELLARFT
ncbi:unnamed protein product [Psylliodes chrysocephalus]|uniref:Uncharacterized protein n=1 Tax=Psylliodes chrysocephalus TaxID=3402493 RepID=A0A9P0DF75_9CUCU|nr:unnamed protein product [Psylliodes chrysocephala]